MVHGSCENKSERSRRAFVLNIFADGTESNSDKEILKGVPPIAKGNKMEGQFFPLIYQGLAFYTSLLIFKSRPLLI
jgi:hypothetical protein